MILHSLQSSTSQDFYDLVEFFKILEFWLEFE